MRAAGTYAPSTMSFPPSPSSYTATTSRGTTGALRAPPRSSFGIWTSRRRRGAATCTALSTTTISAGATARARGTMRWLRRCTAGRGRWGRSSEIHPSCASRTVVRRRAVATPLSPPVTSRHLPSPPAAPSRPAAPPPLPQFIVSRERIRARPHAFWRSLLADLLDARVPAVCKLSGHVLELMWGYLLGEPPNATCAKDGWGAAGGVGDRATGGRLAARPARPARAVRGSRAALVAARRDRRGKTKSAG